jgi:selenium metabolism protein YedF
MRGIKMKEIDVRGMPCPRPVIETKKALDKIKTGDIKVILDSKESCQNVERFARNQGCKVAVSEDKGIFNIEISKEKPQVEKVNKSAIVIMITSASFGHGDERLGEILMKSFLNTLWDSDPKPAKIIFVNEGIQLTTEGSEVLDALKLLDSNGVEIHSCGTCLEFYGLKEKLQVGVISNMYDIVNSLITADKIIKL